MVYVDSTYYKTTYSGSLIPDDELDSFLSKASMDVDQLTYFRIAKKGYENMTEFQQTQIKEAACIQADHLYNYGDMPTPNLDGYSVGGNSVKFGSNVNMRYSSRALDYLRVTGLLYRGLGGS